MLGFVSKLLRGGHRKQGIPGNIFFDALKKYFLIPTVFFLMPYFYFWIPHPCGQSRGHGVLHAMAVTHLGKHKEAYEEHGYGHS